MNQIETEINDVKVIPKRKPVVYKLSSISGLKWLLLAIPLAYIVFFLLFSIISLFKLSIFDENGFTMEHILRIFSSGIYLQVLWLTVKISFIVTMVTLLISYPFAYSMVKMQSKTWKGIMIGVVMIPFWISAIARTFSWHVLLQDQGVINKLLMAMGIIEQPLALLYSTTGVIIGMSHVLLPIMLLSLYSVMEGIDLNLVQAAQGLGARPMKAFFQIFLPLSLPGVFSGSLMVFVIGLGFYITPVLLGGPHSMTLSMVISDNIYKTLNWNFAAALSLVLFISTLLLLIIAYSFVKNNPMIKEDD